MQNEEETRICSSTHLLTYSFASTYSHSLTHTNKGKQIHLFIRHTHTHTRTAISSPENSSSRNSTHGCHTNVFPPNKNKKGPSRVNVAVCWCFCYWFCCLFYRITIHLHSAHTMAQWMAGLDYGVVWYTVCVAYILRQTHSALLAQQHLFVNLISDNMVPSSSALHFVVSLHSLNGNSHGMCHTCALVFIRPWFPYYEKKKLLLHSL